MTDYATGAISRILKPYLNLIRSDPPEELVQSYLNVNPIFWGFLSPARIIAKPCILTHKKADFAILSTNRTLYFVELEKPQTQLVKKDSGVTAELQCGLNQIRDWIIVVHDQRVALLQELGFKMDQVHDIRFILIAGLAERTDEVGLMKLRRNRQFETELICFDELAAYVANVAGSFAFA